MALFRSAIFLAACLPFAFAQPAQENHPGLAEKILIMVGPAEPGTLTQKEQFEEYLLATGGPVPLVGEAVGAGFEQWENSPPEWGQGWGAYGRRYGSDLLYNAVRQTITYGLSVPLHEDDRYFASNATGFWPRTRHALIGTFTARHPSGRVTFSFSSAAGVIGASAISSVWGPPSWKGPGNIAKNAGISFASTAGFTIIREFLSDILRHPNAPHSRMSR